MSRYIQPCSKNNVSIYSRFNTFQLVTFIINKLLPRLNNNIYLFVETILLNLKHGVSSLILELLSLLFQKRICYLNLIFAVVIWKFTFWDTIVPCVLSIWLFEIIYENFCFSKRIRAICVWWWTCPFLHYWIWNCVFCSTIQILILKKATIRCFRSLCTAWSTSVRRVLFIM